MGKYVGFATQSGAQIHKVNKEKKPKKETKMRKSFWLFAIVLSMSLGIRAQAAPREIPDRFNTGVDTDTELTEIPEPGIYGGIQYKTGAGGQLALDLVYSNRQAGNEIEIRNMDFSRYALLMVNEGKIAVETMVTFRNCKFDAVTTGREDARISYVFEDCTLRNFQGSNATFTRCRLGGSSGDALNPYRNVTLRDCYIEDLAHPDSGDTVHSDGVQIFGYPSLAAENISFDNCRFEVPAIPGGGSYVNACLMIAPEKSGAKGIYFTNCILNGGGYAIYTLVKDGFSLENVVLCNISVGDAARYGTFYHRNVTAGVTMENIYTTDTLYVGSRFVDEEGRIHFSVTNDTAQERKLMIVTPRQTIILPVKACPPYEDRTADMTFEDFPFDIDVVVPGAQWAVCYDITDGCTQIALYAERKR